MMEVLTKQPSQSPTTDTPPPEYDHRSPRAGRAVRALVLGDAVPVRDSPRRLGIRSRWRVWPIVGIFRAGSDEGQIGTAASFGGAIIVPLHSRLAAGLDIQTSKVTRIRYSADDFYRTRRTLLIPTLQYRWGNARGYAFVGSGLGAKFTSSVNRSDNFRTDYTPTGWREIRPRVFEIQESDTRKILFAPQVGFAVFPHDQLGMRVDFYMSNWHMGARIGAGYRFK